MNSAVRTPEAAPSLRRRGVGRYRPRHRTGSTGSAPVRSRLVGATMATALAAGTLTAVQVAQAPAAQAAQSDIVQVSAAKRATDQQRLLDAINSYRGSLGLKPVRFSQTLTGIEQGHSDAQVRSESFYHTDQFMTDSRAGKWTHVNEVIALSYQDDVNQLLAWWKTSAAHNAAITSPKAEVIGIGLTYADGSLQNTGQPWRLLGTVNLYGYANGGAPADASSRVSGGTTAVQSASANTAVFGTRGAIGVTYRNNGGSAVFGNPTMDEAAAVGGQYQLFTRNGRTHKFLWSRTTGTHIVKEFGGIGQVWSRNGYETGYGFPTSNEYRYGNEVRQNFSHGVVLAWDVNTHNVRIYR